MSSKRTKKTNRSRNIKGGRTGEPVPSSPLIPIEYLFDYEDTVKIRCIHRNLSNHNYFHIEEDGEHPRRFSCNKKYRIVQRDSSTGEPRYLISSINIINPSNVTIVGRWFRENELEYVPQDIFQDEPLDDNNASGHNSNNNSPFQTITRQNHRDDDFSSPNNTDSNTSELIGTTPRVNRTLFPQDDDTSGPMTLDELSSSPRSHTISFASIFGNSPPVTNTSQSPSGVSHSSTGTSRLVFPQSTNTDNDDNNSDDNNSDDNNSNNGGRKRTSKRYLKKSKKSLKRSKKNMRGGANTNNMLNVGDVVRLNDNTYYGHLDGCLGMNSSPNATGTIIEIDSDNLRYKVNRNGCSEEDLNKSLYSREQLTFVLNNNPTTTKKRIIGGSRKRIKKSSKKSKKSLKKSK